MAVNNFNYEALCAQINRWLAIYFRRMHLGPFFRANKLASVSAVRSITCQNDVSAEGFKDVVERIITEPPGLF